MRKLTFLVLVILLAFPFYALGMEFSRDKNVATNITCPLINATNTSFYYKSANNTVFYIHSSDADAAFSSFAAAASNCTIIDASGIYNFPLNQSEMNHDRIGIYYNGTGCLEQYFIINTAPKTLLTALNGNVSTVNSTVTSINTTVTNANTTITNANATVTNVNNTETAQNTTWSATKAGYLDAAISSRSTFDPSQKVNLTFNQGGVTIGNLTGYVLPDNANITNTLTLLGTVIGNVSYINNTVNAFALNWTGAKAALIDVALSAININASNANITATAIKAKTDGLNFNGNDVNATVNVMSTGAVIIVTNAIWDKNLSAYSEANLAGTLLKGAGAAGDPWSTAIPGAYGAGTAGYIVGNNLNANITSRSNHSAADIWNVGTRLLTAGTNIVLAKGTGITGLNDILAADIWSVVTRQLTSAQSFNLTGNISGSVGSVTNGVTITTNNDKSGYSLAANQNAVTFGNVTVVLDKSGYSISGTKTTLDSLNDITALSIWATSNRTLSDYSGVWSVAARALTDKANFTLSTAGIADFWNTTQSGFTTPGTFGNYLDAKVSEAGGGGLTVQQIVNGVWNETLSNHIGANTTGKKLSEMPTPYDVGP